MKKFIKVLKNRLIGNYHGLWYADVISFYGLKFECSFIYSITNLRNEITTFIYSLQRRYTQIIFKFVRKYMLFSYGLACN
jgi:hypothetical protein